MRTTSSLEAYNGVLNKTIVNKGHFFNFIHDLRAEEFIKREELEAYMISGAKTAKRRRKEYKVRKSYFHGKYVYIICAQIFC